MFISVHFLVAHHVSPVQAGSAAIRRVFEFFFPVLCVSFWLSVFSFSLNRNVFWCFVETKSLDTIFIAIK